MDLWTARTDSLAYLKTNCSDRLVVLSQAFELVDLSIDEYESLSDENIYARICGLTLLKAKHLAVGIYSLILDGLAQESGSLLRTFIEYSELLTYFRMFPYMTGRAIGNNLPKAGERARAIDGKLKEFREHLSNHASHSSYSYYSLSHLLEPKTFRFKKLQHSVPTVLNKNIRDLVIQLYLLAHEGVLCLNRLDIPNFLELATKTDQLRESLVHVFELHIDNH